MRVLVALGIVVAGVALGPQPAPAANASKPRVPVVWGDVPCMQIVDRSQTPVLHLEYTIVSEESYDLTFDEVEDSRRHQFFAFAAQHFEAAPPTWITRADIDRAALVDPMVNPDGIAPDDVLETAARWPADEWVRVTADDMRVPITNEQAMMGVDWDLSDVAPGTWLVKGYTWEPIANKWATRWGAIKVIDSAEQAAEAGPSVILLPDEAFLMTGMEYVPPGCIDAPDGSTLTIEYGVVEGTLEPEWEVAVEDAEVTTGAIATPFVLPSCVAGDLKLRVTITDPDGRSYVAYNTGQLVAMQDPDDEKSCADSDGCGCVAGHRAGAWLFLPLVAGLRRRRRAETLSS